MNKGIVASLLTMAFLFALVLGNVDPRYTKTSDHSVESMPDQVNVLGIDKAPNSVRALGSDRDVAPGTAFDSYGLQGAWRSTQ